MGGGWWAVNPAAPSLPITLPPPSSLIPPPNILDKGVREVGGAIQNPNSADKRMFLKSSRKYRVALRHHRRIIMGVIQQGAG